MTQTQFADLVRNGINNSKKLGSVTREEAKEVVDVVTRAMITALRQDKQLKLDNLGWLRLQPVPEKRGTSNMTGTPKDWVIPPHITVRFKPLETLMAAVNSSDKPNGTGKEYRENRGLDYVSPRFDAQFLKTK